MAAEQRRRVDRSHAGRSRSISRWWLLVPVLAAVAAGAFYFQQPTFEPAPQREVPDPDLSDMPRQVATALSEARRDVIDNIGSAEAWGQYGRWLDAHHLYEHAESAYRVAHELAPNYFPWAYQLALLRDFQGADIEEVIASFEVALRLNDVYPPAPYRYGEALMRQGRLLEARDAFRKAVELDPEFSMAHRGLGHALIALDEPDDAVRHLERAAEIEPEDGVIYTALARAYQMQGKRDRALEAAEKASGLRSIYGVPDPIRYSTENLAITSQSGKQRYRNYMRQGDYASAIADLKDLVEIFTEFETYRVDLGKSHGHLGVRLAMDGDLVGAIAQFEQAAALLPDDAEIHHNWGTALMRLGDMEQAYERIDRALELNPDNPGTHFNQGWVLESLGHDGLAIEHYELAVELGPSPQAAQRLRELGVE
jgi:superkiller protein 3